MSNDRSNRNRERKEDWYETMNQGNFDFTNVDERLDIIFKDIGSFDDLLELFKEKVKEQELLSLFFVKVYDIWLAQQNERTQ